MAYGDKKTILDLVKNVERSDKDTIGKLSKDVLAEKDPTAGGTFEGTE